MLSFRPWVPKPPFLDGTCFPAPIRRRAPWWHSAIAGSRAAGCGDAGLPLGSLSMAASRLRCPSVGSGRIDPVGMSAQVECPRLNRA
jgi:hypothetical protein